MDINELDKKLSQVLSVVEELQKEVASLKAEKNGRKFTADLPGAEKPISNPEQKEELPQAKLKDNPKNDQKARAKPKVKKERPITPLELWINTLISQALNLISSRLFGPLSATSGDQN